MVAEAVAFSPIINVPFNPGFECCQIAWFKVLDVVGQPEGNYEGFLGVVGAEKLFAQLENCLLILGFYLVPIFFGYFANSSSFDPIVFYLFFKEALKTSLYLRVCVSF